MKLRLDNRYVPPLFITCILLVGHLAYGILESYERTALAIVAAIVTELVLGRIFLGKWLNVSSAYITGISVGILIRSPAFWPYALCSVLSIMSKYVLREGTSSVEPVQLRYLRAAVTRAGQCRGVERPMGQLHLADAGDLDSGFDHHLARETFSHQLHLRDVVFPVCVCAQLDYGTSVARGSRADHRADVSTVRVLHDY